MPMLVYILMNVHSGHNDKDALGEKIMQRFKEYGFQPEMIALGKDKDMAALCEQAILRAKERQGMAVAVGGDGTINLIAALCHKHQVLMGLVPLGTFNYFARELGITDEEDALDALVYGEVRTMPVGFVQEHIFLNNACMGIYTHIIRNREKHKSMFGRRQIVAFFSALLTMFRGLRPFTITIMVDDKKIVRKTNLIFVGNNFAQLQHIGFNLDERELKYKLALIILKSSKRLHIMRMLLRGLFKQLQNERYIDAFEVDRAEISSRSRKNVHVVVDGEIIRTQMPVNFRIERHGLQVMAPAAIKEGAVA